MALINRFTDAADERAFILGERVSHRKPTRALLVIGAVMFLGFFSITPVFTQNETFVAFNLSTLFVISSFAFAFYLIGTSHYAAWPILDASPFLVGTIATAIILSLMHAKGGVTPLTMTVMLVGYFAGNIFLACLAFVANVKNFLLTMLSLMAIYLGALFMVETPIYTKLFAAIYVSLLLLVGIFTNWEIDRRARELFVGRQQLNLEREKTETLLYNVLPQSVAKRLRAGEVVADSFSDISIIFIDVIGFSKLSKQLSPGHLVKQLNSFFLIADECADRYGIEKVKTIGDCYLAVSGGTASNEHGAKDAVSFARDVIMEMGKRAEESGVDIKLRAGIHSGPVVGGVVGVNRLAYDYWGDTMNIASRIEGAAEPNGIAVSAATYYQCNGSHKFASPETIALKGVGDVEIYRYTPAGTHV
jgi:adenylate cyclase